MPLMEYIKEFFNKNWSSKFFGAKTKPVEKPDGFIDFPVSLKNKCHSCSKIEDICPVDAIGKTGDGSAYPSIDKDRCIRCGKCAEICPNLLVETSEIKRINEEISTGRLIS